MLGGGGGRGGERLVETALSEMDRTAFSKQSQISTPIV